ncbi:hypothetical protein MASR2M15_16690 [Anaerolineales bacterium]
MSRHKSDLIAIAFLSLLWLIFFWQVLTPVASDQLSFKQGDFSGQFLAFSTYQYERMSAGEIPLWNPYNNGGFPFAADTQAAVFYPPRLAAIALANLTGAGWSYQVLQLEAIVHVWLFSLLMYLFIRRLSKGQSGSIWASLTGAIIMAYGGWTSAYPPLQLALLEAAIWAPLVLLGILEATRTSKIRWWGIIFSGLFLGVSWLAGHPQTSWFISLLAPAYLLYRAYNQRIQLSQIILACAGLGIIAFGASAISLIPGFEYLSLTHRSGLSFDEKSNGFPIQDIVQFIYPGLVSLWSPLFVGVSGFFLAIIGFKYTKNDNRFWFALFIFALLFSMGANTFVYPSLYDILPGLRFFRGQERAAFLVSLSLSILASNGLLYLFHQSQENSKIILKYLSALAITICLLSLFVFIAWLGFPDSFQTYVKTFFISALITLIFISLLFKCLFNKNSSQFIIILLLFVLIFELFSINRAADSNYEAIPAATKNIHFDGTILQIIAQNKQDLARVDGWRGLEANNASALQIYDIRGISPLFLDSAYQVIYRNYVYNPLAWDLYAVKTVFSGQAELPIETKVIAEGEDSQGHYFVHELVSPRPFFKLFYQIAQLDSDEFALALLDDPHFNARETIILQADPMLELPNQPDLEAKINIKNTSPEHLELEISTAKNAILSIAQPNYPGWEATIDGQPSQIIRAYVGLTALAIPAGTHQISLNYSGNIVKIGALISLLTWGFSILYLLIALRHQKVANNV